MAKRPSSSVGGDPLALQPGETDLQHRRFVLWMASNADGGPRSFTKVAAAEGVAESVVREHARRGRWLERASAADRASIARELGAGMEVQRRSIVAQVQLGERLTRILEGIVDELEQSDDETALDKLPAALDATKTLQRVQAALRVALDLPTATTRSEVAVAVFDAGAKPSDKDYSRLSTAELDIITAAHHVEHIAAGGDPNQGDPVARAVFERLARLMGGGRE